MDNFAKVRTLCAILSVLLQATGLWFIITHAAK